MLVEKLFGLFQKHIQEKQIIEEIFENIVIIINDLSSEIMNEQVGDYIQEHLVKFYKCLQETKTSKKIIFKLLDIFEEIDIDIDEFDED